MDIGGLEGITLGNLAEVFKLDELSVKEAIPLMKEFRDKQGLTDRQALRVFGISKRLFGEYDDN